MENILDEVKASFVKDLMSKGKRVDGRDLLQYREISVEKGVLPNDDGSALCRIGGTKVYAAVKFDLMMPFPDRQAEGVFMVGSEFSPMAHPTFEAGPPRENSIELSRIVDRGLRGAEAIDLAELGKTKTEEGKVFALFVDLHVIDHCGNLIDAAVLAASAALSCTRIPKFEDDAIVRGEYASDFKPRRLVAACSFEKIAGKIVADASNEEEVASDGRLTLSCTNDGKICAAQKSGATGFTAGELMQLIDLAQEKKDGLLSKI
ncbi:MAG: RNA-binding protein [Candidatus Micrarchaeota archaeon]